MSRYESDTPRGSRSKIPVTEREFLWVQDDDKGEVILHVGPTMVSPTAVISSATALVTAPVSSAQS